LQIAVIGTGYVGLVTAAVFADQGNDVIAVDVNAEKVRSLQAGRMPFYEPGMDEMVTRNQVEGRLSFTCDTAEAVRRSEVIFICVDTPPLKDGSSDLSRVEAAAQQIARAMNGYKVVVNKSTVPVGTGNLVGCIIEKNRPADIPFDVVSNPEFLREGSAITDSLHPDRIVIGASNSTAALKMIELYAPLERQMLICDVASAEIIKYASNSFLATKISFINAIADLCERVGADVGQVVKGMGADRRIGAEFLSPGLGFGGSCFPKDTLSILHVSDKHGCRFGIVEAALKVNNERAPRFVQRMKCEMGGLQGKLIGLLGLAFKPDTDDLREAKSLEVIEGLLAEGAIVRVYDPVAMEKAKALLDEKVSYCNTAYELAEGCDALAVITEWNEFKQLNLERLHGLMKQPVIFDGRNIYPPERMARFGFRYISVGRPSPQ
jgi:UDPglucose 6-dehydrogenase